MTDRRRDIFSEKPDVITLTGPLSWLTVFCLLGALIFFWGDRQTNARPSKNPGPVLHITDTPVKYQTRDIKDIQIGERLLGKNPIAEEVDDFVPEINPREWRLLNLTMEKQNGKRLYMQFLRPVDWIKTHGAHQGATIDLDLAEFGARGMAHVVSVESCPPIKVGKGNVVTGKFIHESDGNLIDLKIEGQQEVTTLTANHRYWSADRSEFVEAGHLRPGEQVQTLTGWKQVVSLTPHPGNETVYNLEVQREHVYLVGSLGTLVHNSYPGFADDLVQSALRPSRAGSQTSRGIQSLSKKIGRGSTKFGIERTDAAAEKIIREILDDTQTAITRPRGVDIRDSSGRGVRITDDLFDTFLEPGGMTY